MMLWLQPAHPMAYTAPTAQQLPQRPGEKECTFFLKTARYGRTWTASLVHWWESYADLPRPIYCYRLRDSCQYGQRCKFHHPAEKLAGNLAPLNVMGMPGMAPYPMGPGKGHTLSPPLPRPPGCYHGPFC